MRLGKARQGKEREKKTKKEKEKNKTKKDENETKKTLARGSSVSWRVGVRPVLPHEGASFLKGMRCCG